MDSTEQALSAIRSEWIAQGSPPIADLAKRANMPAITARRYLDGSTKHGDPAKVRALAISLGRRDIAETVKDSLSHDLSESVMKFMSEKFLLWRETNLDELAKRDEMIDQMTKTHSAEIDRLMASHQQIVDRLTIENQRLLERNDANVARLTGRIDALERDKANISVELAKTRAEKHSQGRRLLIVTALLITVLLLFFAYFIHFDMPFPTNGFTGALIDLFKGGMQ